jgi:hypothetical protein
MKIHISNATSRDATVVATSTPAQESTIASKNGKPVSFQRYVAAGEGKLNEDLVKILGDAYSQQLIDADPEIDLEMVGRAIDGTSTVLLNKENQPLFCAPEILEIIYGPDGKEVERRTPVDIAPNVNEGTPVKWTGKLLPRTDLIRKYGIKRTMQRS